MRALLALVLLGGIAHAEPADDANTLITKATAYELNGDWQTARALHTQLAAIKGYAAQGLYGEAIDAYQENDFENAAALAAKSAALAGPFHNRAQLLHGDVRYHLADYERAKTIYAAIDATPGEAELIVRKIRLCDAKLAPKRGR